MHSIQRHLCAGCGSVDCVTLFDDSGESDLGDWGLWESEGGEFVVGDGGGREAVMYA